MSIKANRIQEQEAPKNEYPDRWSKDLVGSCQLPTTSGFNLGVAEYLATEFSEPQVHLDQEALYVISGIGELLIGDQIFPLQPGTAVYVPPQTAHAPRRLTDEPVKVVYSHGAV